MKIEQKKLSNIHTFEFKDKFFNFAYKDRSGSGDMDIAYANLARKTAIRIEENTWWRNAGYVWVAIGGVNMVAGAFTGESIFRRAFWLLMGLTCLATFHYSRVKYTLVPFEGGNVFIIQDGKTHDLVLDELMKRRGDQLRSLYGEVDLESSFEREKAKFEYLVEQGVFSREEADGKIMQAAAALEAPSDSAPRMLN